MNPEGTQLRETTIKAVEELTFTPVNFEAFPAQPDNPAHLSIEEVKDADIFIQVICYETTGIVVEEYNQAFKNIPDRILIFVKDGLLSPSSNQHIEKIKQRHTYKKFTSSNELANEVKKGLTSLAASLLKKNGELGPSSETILIDEQIKLLSGQEKTYKVPLSKGDQINGIIKGDGEFNVYFFNEDEYARYLNEEEMEPDAEEVKAYNVDFRIRHNGIYYIVVALPSTFLSYVIGSMFSTVISLEIRRSSSWKK